MIDVNEGQTTSEGPLHDTGLVLPEDTRSIREADFEGPAGRAWKVRVERGDERVRAEQQPHIAGWILHLPGTTPGGGIKLGYSPAWEYYMLGVVHLREVRGVPPAKRESPDMGYEMVLAGIDPQSHPDRIDPDKDWPFHYLEPLNFAAQWNGDLSDEQAETIGFAAVRVLCRGILPPEGHRDVWMQSISTTVQHVREGNHGR